MHREDVHNAAERRALSSSLTRAVALHQTSAVHLAFAFTKWTSLNHTVAPVRSTCIGRLAVLKAMVFLTSMRVSSLPTTPSNPESHFKSPIVVTFPQKTHQHAAQSPPNPPRPRPPQRRARRPRPPRPATNRSGQRTMPQTATRLPPLRLDQPDPRLAHQTSNLHRPPRLRRADPAPKAPSSRYAGLASDVRQALRHGLFAA